MKVKNVFLLKNLQLKRNKGSVKLPKKNTFKFFCLNTKQNLKKNKKKRC